MEHTAAAQQHETPGADTRLAVVAFVSTSGSHGAPRVWKSPPERSGQQREIECYTIAEGIGGRSQLEHSQPTTFRIDVSPSLNVAAVAAQGDPTPAGA